MLYTSFTESCFFHSEVADPRPLGSHLDPRTQIIWSGTAIPGCGHRISQDLSKYWRDYFRLADHAESWPDH